jgi:hypothetical protein
LRQRPSDDITVTASVVVGDAQVPEDLPSVLTADDPLLDSQI